MRLGVVDYETSMIRAGTRPRTKMVGVSIEGSGYQRFNTTDQLMAFLKSQSDIRLYNHTDFDVNQAIVDRCIPDDIMIRGSKVIRCKFQGVEWINSYALFPSKLAVILKACGYEKKALQTEGHTMGCECQQCYNQLCARNESDCTEALAAFIQLGNEYARECGINPVRDGYATAASAAFAGAEKNAGNLPVRLDYRESYRGGRTEAYRLGHIGESDCYDINSSYPYSFLDLPEKDWLVNAEVTVKGDEGPAPFFAANDRKDGLLFPAGKFRTWFFASNLDRYYAKHGNIANIKKITATHVDMRWLKRVAPMLQRIYTKRATGNPGMKFALKIFLNSIYGRLGLKPQRTTCGRGSTIPAGDIPYFRLSYGDYLWFKTQYNRPRANYPFAAAITDNARARLYDMSRRLPTIYVDTDSVYVPKGTVFPEETGEKLGQWKLDKSGYLRIRTVKDYEFAGEVVRKGGRRSTVWTVRLALARDTVKSIEKTRKTDYHKRRVIAGQRTLPHVY